MMTIFSSEILWRRVKQKQLTKSHLRFRKPSWWLSESASRDRFRRWRRRRRFATRRCRSSSSPSEVPCRKELRLREKKMIRRRTASPESSLSHRNFGSRGRGMMDGAHELKILRLEEAWLAARRRQSPAWLYQKTPSLSNQNGLGKVFSAFITVEKQSNMLSLFSFSGWNDDVSTPVLS